MPNAVVKTKFPSINTRGRSTAKNPKGRAPKLKKSGYYRILATLVSTAFLSGFINLIPMGGMYPATLIIDGLYALMFATLVLFAATRNPVRVDFWMLAFVLLVAIYTALFAHGDEPIYDKYLALRNQVLYAFVAIFVATTLRSKEEVLRLLNLAMRLSVWLAAFGILQFIFRSVLPEWLLISRDTKMFGYFGTDISRSTGLIGNTIVFANLLLLFFTLYVAKLAGRYRFRDLIAALILAGGILATFSRMAIAGAIAVVLVVMVVDAFRRNPAQALVRSFFFTLYGAAAAGVAYLFGLFGDTLTESFIYRDLFMQQNASAQASTDVHNRYIDIALATIQENPWFGIGLGTQSQGSINAESSIVITDGAFWAMLAEGGFVLLGAYSIFLIACCTAAFMAWRKTAEASYVAAAFMVFSIYQFSAAAIYNSAFFGKVPFIMYWLVFGIVVALSRLSKKAPALNLAPAMRPDPRKRSIGAIPRRDVRADKTG